MDHLGTVQALNLPDRLHRLESEDEMTRAISALPDLITACQLLIEQYQAVPEFTMGGKLTNEPFLLVMEALKKAGVE